MITFYFSLFRSPKFIQQQTLINNFRNKQNSFSGRFSQPFSIRIFSFKVKAINYLDHVSTIIYVVTCCFSVVPLFFPPPPPLRSDKTLLFTMALSSFPFSAESNFVYFGLILVIYLLYLSL